MSEFQLQHFEIMKDQGNPTNLGAVVSVRGSVMDIRFDAHLPPIYSVLGVGLR